MAPFERPSIRLLPRRERSSSGLLMSWIPKATGRTRRAAIRPYFDRASRASTPGRRGGFRVAEAASRTRPLGYGLTAGSGYGPPGRRERDRFRSRPRPSAPSGALLLLDVPLDRELAVLDAEQRLGGERRVPVFVDRVLAQHALAVFGVQRRVDDRLTVVAPRAGALDGVEDQRHRLVTVDRVGLGVLLVVLLLEVGEELTPGLLGLLLGRHERSRALVPRGHVLRHAALARVDRRALAGTVTGVDLDIGVGRGDVLEDLDAVRCCDPAEEEAVRLDPLRL